MSFRQLLLKVPFAKALRNHRHVSRFLSARGFASRYGVFESFADARRFLPASAEFDEASLAEEYVSVRCGRVFSYDYPVLFWLDKAFREGATRVLDIGGSVGVHYYAYAKHLDYPDALSWRVCEVPAIAAIGRKLACSNARHDLAFVEGVDVSGVEADVWISAGAIHYIENGRPSRLLAAATAKPRYVILNKLPLYDGEDFVSAQNVGHGCFAPHHVYGRAAFIADIAGVGYELVDQWDVPERTLEIPGRPERSSEFLSGLCFRRREPEACPARQAGEASSWR